MGSESAGELDLILKTLSADVALWSDFLALCDCGGRRAGSASEEQSLRLAQQRLSTIGGKLRAERVPYAGWRLANASMTLADGTALVCNPLLGSQPTSPQGVTAELLDLGRGAPEDFERHADRIGGRFVLVRHEYPFSAAHIHRRRKLGWATERGAAGFIIANPIPDAGPVAGSSGRGGEDGIPAVGTDYDSAERLARAAAAGMPARIVSIGEDYDTETQVLILDLPGKSPQWVALSAHLDGHDLAESAMDNGSGVAVVLALARAFAPHVANCDRGLRVCLFSAEEWALAGSRRYLDGMPAADREKIALNINLDTVGGDSQLTALTSEFRQLDAFIRDTAAAFGISLGTYLPMMANSDHFNFARHGIPALRLVAGFDRPQSDVRYILTRGDTRDKVQPAQLTAAARTAAILVWKGLTMTAAEAAALRNEPSA